MKAGRAALLTALALSLPLAAQNKTSNKSDDLSQIGHRDVGKGVNFYSLEKEMALGKQLAEEVQRQSKIVDDPLVSEYVNRLGQNLVRNSDAKVPFTFQVIDSDVPNAFALPGGYVFVNTGLVEFAEEEDELAAAMAHEIAHVAARHMTRESTRAQLANAGLLSAGILFGGWGGLAMGQGAKLAMPIGFLALSRADEAEADHLGIEYLYATGYDPTAMISILEKLDALAHRQPAGASRLFSTHPSDTGRIQKTQSEIQRILPPRDQYVVNTSDYAAMRRRVLAREAQTKPAPEENKPTLLKP
ncbi:MAG TPA: M48 family metalloprotease [Bryobacteraceae bacterium]|nr:M48 family metalloprotease [Bryobacteraceae bacterium]